MVSQSATRADVAPRKTAAISAALTGRFAPAVSAARTAAACPAMLSGQGRMAGADASPSTAASSISKPACCAGTAAPAGAWEFVNGDNFHWKRGFWKRGFPAPKLLLDAKCVVQTCNLKTHGFGGHFTLSLKNSVGFVAKSHGACNYMSELHERTAHHGGRRPQIALTPFGIMCIIKAR